MTRRPPRSTSFPYTPLFLSVDFVLDPPVQDLDRLKATPAVKLEAGAELRTMFLTMNFEQETLPGSSLQGKNPFRDRRVRQADRKSTRLNSSHSQISYAVFCL